MDLCATSLLRWKGFPRPKGDREHDVKKLKEEIKNIKLNPRQQKWFQKISSDRGTKFTDLRHAITHRHIRQDATVGGSPRQTISPKAERPGNEEVANYLDTQASFVEQRWSEFWQAFF